MEEGGGGSKCSPLLGDAGVGEELGLLAISKRESKKLWPIVGPAVFARLSMQSTFVISQACAGHIGDLELAGISIATSVVLVFNLSFMLGMASALETLCGQAFGAGKLHLLGVYIQRSWIVLFITGLIFLPMYFVATPVLEWIGEPPELAQLVGRISIWLVPVHFAFGFLFPIQRFLQSQLKNVENAIFCFLVLLIHLFLSWLLVYKLGFGLVAAVHILNFSWWLLVLVQFAYVVCGGCPDSWKGFTIEAFSGLWDFAKLSASSGVMLCLENWYYMITLLFAGNLKDAEIAVDAFSICMNINNWEITIPVAFFAATGIRVANELGAGNGKGAKFATVVSVVTSVLIGVIFWILLMIFSKDVASMFSSSALVLNAVDKLHVLLALTIFLNSVQPILSGVAIGSGWQAVVAYVNIGTYYLIGVPLGLILGFKFDYGVAGIWCGMISGTIVQTLILALLTIRCDWEKEARKARARVEKWSTCY